MSSSRFFVAAVLTISLGAWLPPTLAAQGPPAGASEPNAQQQAANRKIDPQLLLDGQQLASQGYLIMAGQVPLAPQPLVLPGFATHGFLRVSPDVMVWSGLLTSPLGVVHYLPVPNMSSLIGFTFSMQAADVWFGVPLYDCYFSDNHLSLTVTN